MRPLCWALSFLPFAKVRTDVENVARKAFPSAMQKTSGITLAPPRPSKKNSARVALIDIQETTGSLLSDCFKQFGIEAVFMSGGVPERLQKEKFEACVLHLGAEAEAVMDSARRSPSNSHMVIYGLGGSAQEAMRFSKYGVNAVFQEPLDRPAALKLVRATQMLCCTSSAAMCGFLLLPRSPWYRLTAGALPPPARRSARGECRLRVRRMFPPARTLKSHSLC